MKKYSLLLSGWWQRLLVAGVALAIVWGVYAWAVQSPNPAPASHHIEMKS